MFRSGNSYTGAYTVAESSSGSSSHGETNSNQTQWAWLSTNRRASRQPVGDGGQRHGDVGRNKEHDTEWTQTQQGSSNEGRLVTISSGESTA